MSTTLAAPGGAESLLVETIRHVGISNYSLLGRLTGLNVETVRYKVNKQLNRLGLGIEVNIDYGQTGFSTYVLHVKTDSKSSSSWYEGMPYLTFIGKAMGVNSFTCAYSIPYRFKKRYIDSLLERKKENNVKSSSGNNHPSIEDFEASEVSWLRYPHLRTEFYDFNTGRWCVDWHRIDLSETEVGIVSSQTNVDAKIDYIDAKILHSIQEDPSVNPAEIAKAMGANQRTVRYHYSEHVLKGKYILSNNVRWFRPMLEGKQNELMQIVLSYDKLDQQQLGLVRKLCNRIPFTWLEMATTNNSYYAFLDIPMANFHETLKYIEKDADVFRDQFQMVILDPSRTRKLSFPDEMFDKERGWRLFSAEDSDDLKQEVRIQQS